MLVNVGVSLICGIWLVRQGSEFRPIQATFAPQLAFFADFFEQEKSAVDAHSAWVYIWLGGGICTLDLWVMRPTSGVLD
jgi:hypothetical protein